MGTKDMVIKNKNVRKAVKQTQAELQNANERIAELERDVTTTRWKSGPTNNNAASQTLRKEVEAQNAIATKAKSATQLAESEIDHLRAELCQSSDRETNIRAKGCKAIKAREEKLRVETTTHTITKEENSKLWEIVSKMEGVNIGLQELLEKKKVWYDEQLVLEWEATHQIEVRLKNEMG